MVGNTLMPKQDRISQQNGYQAPAVHKAFQLLRTVAEAPHGLRLVELADRLGYSRSTTHGLVHALLREKALILGDDAHELFLGPTVADLAFTDWRYGKVNRLAQPILNEIRDRTGATVFLGARIRTRVMITASAEAVESLKISAPMGTTLPLFAGAVWKVILAQETQESVLQLVSEKGLPRFTSKTITDVENYLAELEQVRAEGYATDDEEYISGVWAVAVAVNNKRGLPLAIWVVGISSDMSSEKFRHIAEIATIAAKDLRLRLKEAMESRSRSTGPKPGDLRYVQPGKDGNALPSASP